jgi:HSP20 family molecular chaperone IbpA
MKTSASFLASDLNANPHPLEMIRGAEEKDIEQELQQRISDRAYQLYLDGGSSPGHELENWLQAEKQALKRISQIRESGSWVIVNLLAPHVPAEGFKLLISENRALVEIDDPYGARGRASTPEPVSASCYVAEWPGRVDPNTASAYVKNGMLTLEVKLIPSKTDAPRTKSQTAGS